MDAAKETFNYTYSSAQQKEIRSIREKYAPPTQEEDKMERLRQLDRSVTKPGTVISLIVGIVSSLILGVGMSCVMVWADTFFIPGIIIGIIGIFGVIAAYPNLYAYHEKATGKAGPRNHAAV